LSREEDGSRLSWCERGSEVGRSLEPDSPRPGQDHQPLTQQVVTTRVVGEGPFRHEPAELVHRAPRQVALVRVDADRKHFPLFPRSPTLRLEGGHPCVERSTLLSSHAHRPGLARGDPHLSRGIQTGVAGNGAWEGIPQATPRAARVTAADHPLDLGRVACGDPQRATPNARSVHTHDLHRGVARLALVRLASAITVPPRRFAFGHPLDFHKADRHPRSASCSTCQAAVGSNQRCG
jgi:hypothetical protein